MQIKFVVDYRGKLTREKYYVAGEVATLEDSVATRLIEDGRAVASPPPSSSATVASFYDLTVRELRDLLRERELSTKGNKKTLIARLEADEQDA